MRRRPFCRWLIGSALVFVLLVARAEPQSDLDAQLLEAAVRADLATVADLLAAGADVNAENEHGSTALYIAAERGDLELAKLMLEHGADPDTKDLEWGRTALRHASIPGADPQERADRAEMLKLLLAKGAGSQGESLDDLIRGGHVDVARAIIDRGEVYPPYLNQALRAARRAQATELTELLIEAGATEPGPLDSTRSPERLRRLTGVYRSQSGRELILRPSLQDEEQLLLERAGLPPVMLLPLDLLTLRSFDRQIVLTLDADPLPPAGLRMREQAGAEAEAFERTGDVAAAPRATESTTPAASGRARDVTGAASLGAIARDGQWPSYRGVHSSGIAEGVPPPTVWDVETGLNVRWKTPIPGLAHSSPIVWGDRVFVTTAVPLTEADVTFRHGSEASSSVSASNRSTRDDVPHSWRTYALDKQSGEILWERVAHEGVPRTARHVAQSQANSTPATDGTHLIVWFGSEGLYCYALDGKLLWKRDLGALNSGYVVDPSYEWTSAASPIIYQNLVILQVDLLRDSFIAAYGVETGQEVWRTPREDAPSWATPLIYETPSRTELVTLAPNYARGYDPATGRELWRLGRHSIYAVPTPIGGRGLIFLTSGSGNTLQPIYAIRSGASGDITLGDDEATNEHVAWSKTRGGSFIPTPILYADLLYVTSGSGVLAAYQAETGERVFQQRVTRGGRYTASPVAADGKIYFASEDGAVIVIKAGRDFERLAVNQMGELIMATPAISKGMIIVRTQRHVVAIAESTPASSASH